MNLIKFNVGRFGLLIAFMVLLAGCFESSNNSIAELSGSVGDGPIINASITVLDKSGNQIIDGTSDNTASYLLSVDTSPDSYPLTIIATGGTDLVTGMPADFALQSVAMNAGASVTANINPFSTLIVATAQRSASGLNAGSLFAAETAVLSQLNFGLDPALLADPIGGDVSGNNIANVVKASEAAGEMVRRVANALASAGFALSPDEVVAALAADLVDGVVDGRGASGSDPRTAAVANLVAAQITVESMSNDLMVLGTRAENLMDQAILVSFPGAPSSARTGNVTLNQELKSQSLLALGAASALNPSASLEAVINAVSQLNAGATAAQARAALPSQSSSVLGASVAMVAQGSNADLELVNAHVRNDGPAESPVNHAPEISGIPASSVTAGSNYFFQPTALDIDGDSLTFSITGKPDWATFSSANGQLSGITANTDIALWSNIQISVSDGSLSASLPVFSITVAEGDSTPPPPPPPPPTGNTGLFANGVAVDGAVLSPTMTVFEYVPENGVVEVRAWCCAASGESHLFTQTDSSAPFQFEVDLAQYSAGQEREFYLDRVMSDGSVVQDYLALFTISGETPPPPPPPPSNNPPSISGTPATEVQEGESYYFQPGASDPDGDALQFSIVNKPSWASFSTSSGTLSGTPGASGVGTTSNIAISVSDGNASASLASFSITVSAAPPNNRAPVISGNPESSILAGETYVFAPNASDPDGDTLQFSVVNLPSWASFNPNTGALTGSPESADAGTYYDVTISVSDGSLSASLPAFAITVTDFATGYALLSWIPPTERVDGTPLDQLAGFKVFLGVSPNNLVEQANLNDSSAVDYLFDSLPAGTHYFAVLAYDSAGLESDLSNVASKTIE